MTDLHCCRCRKNYRVYRPLSRVCPACGADLAPGVGRRTRPDRRLSEQLERLTPAEARRRELDARRPEHREEHTCP